MKRDLIPIITRLRQQPDGFTAQDLADASGLERTAAGSQIGYHRKTGRIFTAHVTGQLQRHFDTIERRDAWLKKAGACEPQESAKLPEAIARAAVAFMRNKPMVSTLEVAQHVECSASQVDAALAPLVDAKHLVRVVAMRGGVNMFDYRPSAAWKPQEGDFEVCRGATIAPTAVMSPVAPAAPQPISSKPGPASFPQRTQAEARESGQRGARALRERNALERSSPQPGAQLGWVAAKQENTVSSEPPSTAGNGLREIPAAPLPDPVTEDVKDTVADGVLDVVDPVFALNSLGQMVIAAEGNTELRFKPKDTLALYRFLIGASFLEHLPQGAML